MAPTVLPPQRPRIQRARIQRARIRHPAPATPPPPRPVTSGETGLARDRSHRGGPVSPHMSGKSLAEEVV